jgi:hypothetical protein
MVLVMATAAAVRMATADAVAINHLVVPQNRFPAILIKKATSLRFAKPPVYRCRALSPS